MANERVTPMPSLIIGLGGTGLKVATFVKKSLLEANRNQLPPQMAILVLDTMKVIDFKAGGWGRERDEFHATGPVEIKGGEYLPLTGNVSKLIDDIMNEQAEAGADPLLREGQAHRHISSWFQGTYYRKEVNTNPAQENLDVGAARFRQFGRLGFFTHLTQVSQEKLRGSLKAIKQMGADRLYVHIVGSLAGGTGASLFIDIAHLVKPLAKLEKFSQTPVVFGHFVLPEAFAGTDEVQLSNEGVLEGFQARSFAALRELTRLQGTTVRIADGYPMVYDPGGTGSLNGRLAESPYSVVYLYDGVTDREVKRNQDKIEEGLAPSIADVIVSYVDDKSGGAFVAQSVNYLAFYSDFGIPPGQVTYGSAGTFTIELPIYHITEGWAHDLASQVLETLRGPEEGTLPSEVRTAVDTWIKTSGTGLVNKLAEWGLLGAKTSELNQQAVDEVLALDATGWQQSMSALGDAMRTIVDQSRIELEGSLRDQKSHKYYIKAEPLGSSDVQRADNLKTEVDAKIRLMVGDPAKEGYWLRSGGEFRRALGRLGGFHLNEFSKTLDEWLRTTLNGSASLGEPVAQKRGKLLYAKAFLTDLLGTLKASALVLKQAEADSKTKRKQTYDALESNVKLIDSKMRKGSGLFGSHYKDYVNRADDLAQFHKADIARQIAFDLVEKLQVNVEKALDEINRWDRILFAANVEEGGVNALVQDGKREVVTDREKSQDTSRWVIADKEPGDEYIPQYRNRYMQGQLDAILQTIKWTVGRTDNGDLHIDFKVGDDLVDRLAGTREQRGRGVRSANQFLDLCRKSFVRAWEEMSVTAYLEQRFGGDMGALADRIEKNSGYLLQRTTPNKLPPMRSTFMRVSQSKLNSAQIKFLTELRQAVSVRMGDTVDAEKRAKAAKAEYLSESGQDSRDPFKLTFIMFGDLLKPEEIHGIVEGEGGYHLTSGRGSDWKALHILPAETNALAIERQLTEAGQKRRQLREEVVVVLEDIERFRLAMRCLAYGDTEYNWQVGGARGMLLHKYTAPGGLGNWRLTVQPTGTRSLDGALRTRTGFESTPTDYQLTNFANEPDLLQAFIQIVCAEKDSKKGIKIDWVRVMQTLQAMMERHRDEWARRDSTWVLNSKFKNDVQRLMEAQDRAAHIIRLNALIAKADEELEKHPWAWAPIGNPPAGMLLEQRIEVQKYVDLWTAIKMVVLEEMENYSRRFNQLAAWKGEIPTEKISLHTGVTRGELEGEAPAPSESAPQSESSARTGEWICPNGHHNPDSKKHCTICGKAREQQAPAPELEPIQRLASTATQPSQPQSDLAGADSIANVDPFARLERLRREEILTQEEYDTKRTALEASLRPNSRRRTLLKQALDDGDLTREEYEDKLSVLDQAEGKRDERRARLDELLREGILSEEQYHTKLAQLND